MSCRFHQFLLFKCFKMLPYDPLLLLSWIRARSDVTFDMCNVLLETADASGGFLPTEAANNGTRSFPIPILPSWVCWVGINHQFLWHGNRLGGSHTISNNKKKEEACNVYLTLVRMNQSTTCGGVSDIKSSKNLNLSLSLSTNSFSSPLSLHKSMTVLFFTLSNLQNPSHLSPVLFTAPVLLQEVLKKSQINLIRH